MKARTVALYAISLAACVEQATGAEDHSQHQQAEHQHETPSQAAGHDSHAQHEAPAQDTSQTHVDEHAHHRSAPRDESTEGERTHVPPDPPQHFMGDMPKERMIELMQMEDDAPFGIVLLDQLEWRAVDGADAQVWELDAWYGDDYNKIWFETEGERVDGEEDGRVEIMWDRIISPWWSLQTGLRQDFSEGPSRTWFDVGIQGLAPYFFEIDAAIYIGEEGRTAFRFSGEYDVLITQRLVLQPELETRLFGKNDPENGIGSGLSDVEIGVRLRYEFLREFAPYIGVHWARKFGRTADLARDDGEDASDVVFVAGLRAWF